MKKSTQAFIPSMTGYKATDANMTCSGTNNGKSYSQTYELGKWYEVKGDIVPCQHGFHFCEQPSGPWAYYSSEGTRVFKVEAEDVLVVDFTPGADFKRVARKIRLTEEIISDGNRNTGDSNTGDSNTGNRNTGWGNTGWGNTGNRNTGDSNTGWGNTGNRNTGWGNTGDSNTGDSNTGDSNTGWGNTGDSNTGDSNTGWGNTGNYHSGFFCFAEEPLRVFDVEVPLTRTQFMETYPEYQTLLVLLGNPEPIEFNGWAHLPGITEEKLSNLHAAHLEKIEAVKA